MDSFDTLLYGILAVVVVYVVAKTFFSSSAQDTARVPIPRRKRMEPRDLTREELKQYDGSDPTSPILMAVRGNIYDVTNGSSFYGPGGPYNVFTGKDASRALAKSSTDPKDAENSQIEDLTSEELNTLDEWESHYKFKYEYVGKLVD